MDRKIFLNTLKKKVLLLDGGYGTEFIKRGYSNIPAELLNIVHPEVVYQLHSEYIEAGADIILTNTFSANRKKLKELKLEEDFLKINSKAVEIAKNAARDKALVFGDISSLGVFPKPIGDFEMKDVIEEYYQQAKILYDAGVDGFIVETMSDLKELKAAILGMRKVTSELPLIVHMTFEKNGYSITGTSVEIFANVVNDLDVDVIGINCTLGPDELLDVFQRLSFSTNKAISVEPNAGKPIYDGKTIEYRMTPEIFGMFIEDYVDLGANIIGGCCGTTPLHIKVIKNMIKNRKPKKIYKDIQIMYSSRTILKKYHPFTIIGEKINPAGNSSFQKEIEEFNFQEIIRRANSQKSAGADALDINVGIEKVLSSEHIKQIILELDRYSSLPLSLDIQNLDFLETALVEYPGRPIINSSKLTKEDLDKKLELIRKYGGMLIILPMEKDIPQSAEERFQLILKRWKYIEKLGFDKNQFIIDPLVLSVAANYDENITLDTIKLLASQGFNTTIGLSNLSFGLPNRSQINAAFLSRAIYNGLNSAIMNPEDSMLMNTLKGNQLLDGNLVKENKIENRDKLIENILQGNQENLKKIIQKELEEKDPLEVSQNILGKAMEQIGDLYSEGKIYLPELLLASETVKPVFDYINQLIGESETKKAKVVIATVEGDIHDIGKNIVATVLRSSNFEVIDLGKDVETQKIVDAVNQEKPQILGLSAMMTTTVGKIEEVVSEVRELNFPVKIIAGGASMNKQLAYKFGCDAYAKDASEGLKICKRWIEEINYGDDN
ncbi:MAG TPA: homocysteine S-methyltransferase family protein [Defluviitoga sp.]|nr:homocysteine S-methyltransferase family protein [Defluviitoga sp.]HOP24143.1 homocysteine S-methyltransferase family protein [Defluviitoga sp.]HPZ28523.1 homocysteine S-methyltransferase family protein [Defluviitoga sp.]HQD62439.1 homocysteine S-methyltransferase family protein [Defluviitoga sp.]